jgi:exodeoxyribonuclease V beta subunit
MPVVVALLQRVLATPLDASGLRLQDIGSRQRLNELEFTYPLAWLRAETLRALLARHGCMAGPFRERLERLEFSPLHGYMKGFIDLVFEANGRFYLVDYKSNWLGATPAAYRREDLEAAMAREAYRLQYLIYTVALHRYLRVRVADYAYEKHFGGVFYLFLRGMDPATGPQCGVFHDCPTPALIAALDQLMATGEVAKSTS